MIILGGVKLYKNNIQSFKITQDKNDYYLIILLKDRTGYNINYKNYNHLRQDVLLLEKELILK